MLLTKVLDSRTVRIDTIRGLRFDADGAFAGNRRDDTYTKGRQTHCYIILEALYFGKTRALGRNDLIESHRRADGSLDALNLDIITLESVDNQLLVGQLLVLIDFHGIVALHKQIGRRENIIRVLGTDVVWLID